MELFLLEELKKNLEAEDVSVRKSAQFQSFKHVIKTLLDHVFLKVEKILFKKVIWIWLLFRIINYFKDSLKFTYIMVVLKRCFLRRILFILSIRGRFIFQFNIFSFVGFRLCHILSLFLCLFLSCGQVYQIPGKVIFSSSADVNRLCQLKAAERIFLFLKQDHPVSITAKTNPGTRTANTSKAQIWH